MDAAAHEDAAPTPTRLLPTEAERLAASAIQLALESDDAAGVVAVMCTHAQSACVQALACGALCQLVLKSGKMRAAVVAAGALKPLLAALHTFPGDIDILQAGIPVLSLLVAGSSAETATAAALGGINVVVDALLMHTSQFELAQNAVSALSRLMMVRENCAAAIAAGAAAALVAVQHAHLANAKLQGDILQCVFMLLQSGHSGAPVAVERLQTAGAASASLAALRQHPADARVQDMGWRGFAKLHTQDEACCAAGTFQLAVAALRTHAGHAGVHDGACSALATLAYDHAGYQRRALDAGALDALVELLQKEATHDTPCFKVRRTLLALSNCMSNSTDALQRAGRLGAVEAVIKVMLAHDDDAGVQMVACTALCNLVLHHDGHMATALRARATTAAHAAWHTCLDNAVDTKTHRVRDLLNFLRQGESEAVRSGTADAAMASPLADEETQHIARPAAPLNAKSKSGKKKRGGSGSGNGAANANAATASLPADEDAPAAGPPSNALLGGATDADSAGALHRNGAAASHAGGAGGDVADAERAGSTLPDLQEGATSGALECGSKPHPVSVGLRIQLER
jgi:hypothetical protein